MIADIMLLKKIGLWKHLLVVRHDKVGIISSYTKVYFNAALFLLQNSKH